MTLSLNLSKEESFCLIYKTTKTNCNYPFSCTGTNILQSKDSLRRAQMHVSLGESEMVKWGHRCFGSYLKRAASPGSGQINGGHRKRNKNAISFLNPFKIRVQASSLIVKLCKLESWWEYTLSSPGTLSVFCARFSWLQKENGCLIEALTVRLLRSIWSK